MNERPRFFDDLAGVAGGALSAFSGLRDEMAALIRARIDEAVRKLDVVRRDEFEAMAELAAKARAETESLAARVAALEATVIPAAPRDIEPAIPQSDPAPESPPDTDHA